MKYSALDIVHYIITYSCEMNMRITNLRLQKLLYFIQQEYLKDYGKPLFFDDICAWKYGPVVPNVYYIYSGYGGLPILNKYESNLPNEIKKYIEKIVDKLNRDLQRYMNAIDEGKWPLMVLTKEAEGKVLFKDIQAQTENCMVNIGIKYIKMVKGIEDVFQLI